MKVLVVGSGGREHALTWKIAQSKRVKKIYAAPGNSGMSGIADLVNIKADDVKALCNFAQDKKIDLTVVGPEAALAKGIVDEFEKSGLRIFGPGRDAAQLEASKAFAKEMMAECAIPTADFEIFDSKDKALAYIKDRDFPLVIKVDGLASGKGVFISRTEEDARETINDIISKETFVDSGKSIVI